MTVGAVGARVKGLGNVVEKDRRLGGRGFIGNDADRSVGWVWCGTSLDDKELRPNATEVMDIDLRKVGRIDARFAAGTVLSTI